jgi:dihydrofolate reductase
LKRFKELTTGNVVIMGRKTFESIGKPLPNRTNIVISKTLENQDGITICKSLEECLEALRTVETQVFVIGGAEVYNMFLPLIRKLYVTIVNTDILIDEHTTKFPDFEYQVNIIETEYREKDDKNKFDYRTIVMEVI